MAVPSRLGLGGVSSPHRDVRRITALVPLVRSGARSLAILVGGDGLASAVTAVLRVCRPPLRTGRRGRPRWVEEPGRRLGPVVKRDVPQRVVRGARRVVRGTKAASAVVLTATPSGPGSKTAACAADHRVGAAGPLWGPQPGDPGGRRWAGQRCHGRAAGVPASAPYWPPREAPLGGGAGAAPGPSGQAGRPAAGRTDQRWTRLERRRDQGPLPAWVAPQRRGRPPTRALQPALAEAA